MLIRYLLKPTKAKAMGSNRKNLPVLLVLLIVLLGSCAVKQNFSLNKVKVLPNAFKANGDTLTVIAQADSLHILNPAPLDQDTLSDIKPAQLFADPILVSLIDEAIANNQDLRAAFNRVEASRQLYRISKAALFPAISTGVQTTLDRYGRYTMNGVGNYDTNFSPNLTENMRLPDPMPDIFVGFRTSWEVDIWGKLSSRKKAAQNRVWASEAGRQWVKTQLVSEVARQYYMLLSLDAEQEIIKTNTDIQTTALDLVKAQKSGGRATELAVQQTQGLLMRTRSLQYVIRQQIIEAEARLNQLLGRYPQPIKRGPELSSQPLPKRLMVGLPARIIMNRPDVRMAYYELAATLNEGDAAHAQLYPSFTFNPYLGLNSFALSTILSVPASVTAGFFSAFTMPLLNRNAAVGERDALRSMAREKLELYEKTLINSYVEVATGMSRIQNNNMVNLMVQREFAAQNRAVRAGNELYTAGYANYLELLTAQRSVLESELALVTARRNLLFSIVDLYQATGGGWK